MDQVEPVVNLYVVIFFALGPLMHFLFYGNEVFGIPKLTTLLYLLGFAAGFTIWNPMLIITLSIGWLVVIGNWALLIWGILRYEKE